MRIGSFIAPDDAAVLAAAGGAYVELFLTRTVGPPSAEDFARLVRLSRDWPIRPTAFSGLVPPGIRITGPTADPVLQGAYLREMFSRVGQLSGGGDAVVVFGSGAARSIPEGFSRDLALDQLEDFLRRAAALAADGGITFALEPLNSRESNVFNSLAESGTFIRQRGLSDVFLLADLFHIMEESEPLDVIDEVADLIVHAHVADTARGAPGTGSYPLVRFFAKLRENGYTGDCSIECVWDDFPGQVEQALAHCRKAANSAGW